MKKLTKVILIFSVLTTFSFTTLNDNSSKYLGKYGDEEFYIFLKDENTFEYVDKENKKEIYASGSWKIEDNYLILIPKQKTKNLKKKWQIMPNDCGLVYKSFWIKISIGKQK